MRTITELLFIAIFVLMLGFIKGLLAYILAVFIVNILIQTTLN